MQDNIETTLLRKSGDNRRAAENNAKEIALLKNRLVEAEKKINGILLEVEMLATLAPNREAYLKGEDDG